MTTQIRRRLLAFRALTPALVIGLASACSSPADPSGDDDPCALRPVVPGGSVELGRDGNPFTPIVDGQDMDLVVGSQGLDMFVLGARTQDLEVGSGDREGVVVFSAFDAGGQLISFDFSCRIREFVPSTSPGSVSGSMILASAYGLPLRPEFITPQLEGSRVTLQAEVRDTAGRRAIGRITVIVHLPI